MKILKALLAVGCLAIGGGFVGVGAASADTRCTAVAVQANGNRLRATRSVEVRARPRAACRVAVRGCENRLDRLRYNTGRRMPFARCEVVRQVRVSDRYDRGRRYDGRYGGGYDRGPRYGRGGFQCNYRACSNAYRSFRASDCTYQPYHGPRQLCTK